MAGEPIAACAPAMQAGGSPAAASVPETAAIIIELANGTQLKIGAQCPAALAMAALQALR
jgi:hypothetical protein